VFLFRQGSSVTHYPSGSPTNCQHYRSRLYTFSFVSTVVDVLYFAYPRACSGRK
jgi:hypothetical protein